MSAEQGLNSLEAFRSEQGGVLLVDKPLEWTSFDVVKKVRGMIRVKKAGHAGTLDPLATGLLILCSNRMTKSIDSYQAQRKTYEGVIAFGAETESYDAATEPINPRSTGSIDLEAIRNATTAFTGDIMQKPPMYSAVKVQGTRLYKLARKGTTVEREARPVTVYSFDIHAYSELEAQFTIECSKGTYIRSLAHDLGAALGCGGYLKALRRTKSGDFCVDDAWTIDGLQEAAHQAAIHASNQVNDR